MISFVIVYIICCDTLKNVKTYTHTPSLLVAQRERIRPRRALRAARRVQRELTWKPRVPLRRHHAQTVSRVLTLSRVRVAAPSAQLEPTSQARVQQAVAGRMTCIMQGG